jgi:hypothetical protein
LEQTPKICSFEIFGLCVLITPTYPISQGDDGFINDDGGDGDDG